MKSADIVGYFYEGKSNCISCARKRFGRRLNLPNLVDREGNVVVLIRSGDEVLYCDTCAERMVDDLEIGEVYE